MIQGLKFWWYRQRHDHPCKEEIVECLKSSARDPFSRTFLIGAAFISSDATLESVADHFEVTRERVRQVLWKIQRGWT